MATIQGVYVALFGRPADPTGLAYFNTVTNNGANLSAINNLAGQKEYTDRFAGQNNVQIVSSIYQSLFNRAPEADGLNFFVNALNTGSLNINNIAIAILDGAQGTDAAIRDAKIASANVFTGRLDTAVEIGQYVGNDAAAIGRAFLAPVTTTVRTAAEADAQILTLSVGNTSIALTALADVVNLTSATATLKSTNNNDTIDAVTVANSLTSNDVIDGGLGTDTLNASIAGAVAPTVSSVEIFNVTSTNAAAAVDFANITGEQQVWNNNSATALAFTNIDLGTALGIQTASAGTSFGFRAASVTGTADAATLNLKSAALTGAVTINAIETLTIATSGTVTTGAGTITGSTLKDVKITGDVGGTFNIVADTTLKSVDASAVNGSGVTLTIGAATQGVTVTGSKFADSITLSSVGGVGTDKDVVVYNSTNVSTATQLDTIVNFTTTEDKIDLKAFGFTAGLTSITTFGASPIQGSSFLGNSVGQFDLGGGNTAFFADINKNGVFDAATDLQVTFTGAVPVIGDIVFA